MSSASFYTLKAKYGGIDVSDARRLSALEDENAKLKNLLADAMLDAAALKELLAKNGRANRVLRRPAQGMSRATRRCSARCRMPAPCSKPGGSTTTPTDRTRGSAG